MSRDSVLGEMVPAADAKKARSGASEATRLIPRPPSLIGRLACDHCVSVRSKFVIQLIADCSKSSKVVSAA